MNVFSSLVATTIFALNGIIHYLLGIILSITMFIGGIIGSRIALKISNLWLQCIFLITVIIPACKMMIG